MRGRLGDVAYSYSNIKSPESSFKVSGTFATNSSLTFTDTSVRNPTSWSWDFGDGTTSTSQSPSHTYTNSPWTVTIGLTVSNSKGSDYSNITFIDGSSVVLWGMESYKMKGYLPNGVVSSSFDTGSSPGWNTDFIIDPSGNLVLIGNFTGHIKSYNTNGVPNGTFSTFNNLQASETSSTYHTKIKEFDNKIYTNAGGYNGSYGGNNQINIINYSGSLDRSINVNLSNVIDFWYSSSNVYVVGATAGGYRVEKINVTNGVSDSTFRTNTSTFNGVPTTIEVSGSSVFINGDFTLYGASSSQGRALLSTTGTTTKLYTTANSYEFIGNHGGGNYLLFNPSYGGGISSLSGTTLEFSSGPGKTASTAAMLTFDKTTSGGDYYYMDSNGTNSWLGTPFNYSILKVNSVGAIDYGWTFSSGVTNKVIRHKNGVKP